MAGDDASSSASHAAQDNVAAVDTSLIDSAIAGELNHALRATAESILATLADAEDASVGFLDDLLDDMFAAMRVAQENERALRVATSHAWRQAFEGFVAAASDAIESVDADDHGTVPSRSNGQRLQFLRPRIDDDTDNDDKAPVQSLARARRRRRSASDTPAPVVPFLTALWTLVDHQATFVESQLAQFESSRFHVSAVPTHGRAGEWCIAVEDLGPFLRRVVRAARLSVLPSAVAYVVSANATVLEKKAKARATLHMSHIALCVQTALLKAEASEGEADARGDDDRNGQRVVFQTEVPLGGNDELLVYYDEGVDLPLLGIDRNATGSVSQKTELGSTIVKKQRLAKSIVSLLQQRESERTKWGALRKRMFVRENHVGVAVETDMVLDTAPPTAFQKTPTAAKILTLSPKKKASIAASSPTPRSSMLASPSRHFREPDTATLANIFSLGTPRQLSPDELARRNDILSLLEREEAVASRRMAVASITSVSVPPPCLGADGKPIVSDSDKAFQTYVAANSSVTVTSGSCIVPAATGGSNASPDKGGGAGGGKPPGEPKRSRAGSDANGKTKFELALEPPRFEVADGNFHVRMAAQAVATEAVNKRMKSRGGVKSPAHALSPSGAPARSNPQPLSPQQPHSPTLHARPLETASGHLPQLDTSRLAMGVKAVVRGIEKRGPRHDPSRNSRLRLHNYMSSSNGDQDDRAPETASTTVSPEKREHLPPVSPIKASPHRKHVAFPAEFEKETKHISPHRPPPQLQEPSPVPPSGLRRFPAKQPTFEKRASPPRVRNRYLTENANNSTSKKQFARAKWAERDADDDLAALNAPRRNLACNETMADY